MDNCNDYDHKDLWATYQYFAQNGVRPNKAGRWPYLFHILAERIIMLIFKSKLVLEKSQVKCWVDKGYLNQKICQSIWLKILHWQIIDVNWVWLTGEHFRRISEKPYLIECNQFNYLRSKQIFLSKCKLNVNNSSVITKRLTQTIC